MTYFPKLHPSSSLVGGGGGGGEGGGGGWGWGWRGRGCSGEK